MSVINISELVGKLIHTPLIYNDNNEEMIMYVKIKDRTQDMRYRENMSKTMNSPNNIRRIFLTYSGVTVNWYLPYIENKRQLKTFTKTLHFNDSIDYIASEILNSELKATEETQSKIIGSPISLINNLYECSNIEEIYFDWSYTLADGCIDSIKEIANRYALDRYEFINSIRYSQGFKEIKTQHFRNIVEATLGENWRKMFPRLHQVGIISNLDTALKSNTLYGEDSMLRSIGKISTWTEVNKGALLNSKSTVIIDNLGTEKTNTYINKEFIVEDTIFKFDKDYLQAFSVAYNKKASDFLLKEKYMNTGEVDDEVVLNPLENRIKEIYEEFNEEPSIADSMISLAFGDLPLNDRRKLVASLSLLRRDKIGKILGV